MELAERDTSGGDTARQGGFSSRAEECLPFVARRADENRQVKTLLRATFVPASQAAEGLLRATITDGDEVSGDQLLRAMNDEQAE